MTPDGAPAEQVRLLVRELVDDAGLFPPTALPMAEAVERHRADAAADRPMLTHRFLCPASRVAELLGLLEPGDRFALGLIADRGAERLARDASALAADPRVRLAHLELPLAAFTSERDAGDTEAALDRALTALSGVPSGVPAYVEPAVRAASRHLLTALTARSASGARPLGAKLRCGGVRAGLFPTPGEVADFVLDCVASGVPFKATAGLHEAVRHTDPATGFTHHGFLNLLLATAEAVSGGGREDVLAVLREQDAAALASRAYRLDAREVRAARASLVSYGSCSTALPVRQAGAVLRLGPAPLDPPGAGGTPPGAGLKEETV
ncbi:hypothetical protein AB0J21_16045 [Streptomyces sp. NPDC049954]|uniref:hypothetical protein n=1 Tax=Streptomyces sp. NPDC049954 TaxID=3155779 RepID=UPI00341A6E15